MSQPVATALAAVFVTAVAGVLVGVEWVGAWLLFVAPLLVAPVWTTIALKPWRSPPHDEECKAGRKPPPDAPEAFGAGRADSEDPLGPLVAGVRSVSSELEAIRARLTDLVSLLEQQNKRDKRRKKK